jgi:hypothetical protein
MEQIPVAADLEEWICTSIPIDSSRPTRARLFKNYVSDQCAISPNNTYETE